MAIVYFKGCNVELVGGECPAGEEVQVTYSTVTWMETVLPPLTSGDLSALGGAILLLMVMAWGLREIRLFLLNRKGG